MNDCVIVGGGLSGCLLFYALKYKHPQSKVLLIEGGATLGGNHTWCFHEGDIKNETSPWIFNLITKTWDSYEVLFPKYRRELKSFYHGIKSSDLHQTIIKEYSGSIMLSTKVRELGEDRVFLENGEVITGRCIVDARGWDTSVEGVCGYQKFVGLEVKLKRPHGIQAVRLKDATVDQIDGYRFIYVLPWSEKEILIEDTYYSNDPHLDEDEIKKRILTYAGQEGWEIDEIMRVESGCLKLVSSFPFEKSPQLSIGARSGAYHPVTGYTFPQTFKRINALSDLSSFDPLLWRKTLSRIDAGELGQRRYFHLLNKMLFQAADPEKRYLILERFYQLPQKMIEKFYRGQFSIYDKCRLLCGKPPVSIPKAMRSIFR